jgi:hypothetical protein
MIRVEYSAVTSFNRQLQQVPAHLRTEVRRHIQSASGKFVGLLRGNYGWSSRIPGAVKQRVGFGPRSGGVLVYIDADMAPHARPLEFGNTRSGFNRHPVYGGPAWVDQPTRPTFMPTIRSAEPMVVREIQEAINAVFRPL